MTERRVDTELWAHPDFQALRVGAKLLYLYSWSNSHCNAAGIYRISLETIAFETGLNLGDIPGYLEELKSLDIEWNGEQKVLWVKKFVKHQGRSPLFLKAVATSLKQISNPELVKTYLKFNDTIPIPYANGIDTVSMGYSLDSDSDSDSVKTQTKTQYSGVDTPYMDSLKERFPNVDIHSEWADCQTWWAEHGKTMKAPRSALTNWLKNHAKRNGNVERPYTGR
ncbi:MAG: hypothetical protein WC455_18850 [Dehalococcoidia bacterium]|jgi:hypothetical protein